MQERQDEEMDRLSVPRKKRGMKSQPRQIQSSIDVLAEVLAERCGEEANESNQDGAARTSKVGGGNGDFGTESGGGGGGDGGGGKEGGGADGDDECGGSEEDYEDEEEEKKSFESKPDDKARKRCTDPYKFTPCKLRNRHFLKEGQGLAMIRSLGLEQFLLHTEVPRFNKSYCTEFITTYSHGKGAGVVNGRVIKITAQAVRKLTGLPFGNRGDRAVVHDVRAEDLPVMDRLIPGLKRTSYGYDLRYLRYRDQTETFVAVAGALSEKLVCRTFKLTYIKGAIILAMETSLRLKVSMQWADFMADTIKNAIKLTQMRTRNVRFAFGEWLTGLIENALSGGEEAEAEGEGGGGSAAENGDLVQEKEEAMENDAALLIMAATPPEEGGAVPAIEAPPPPPPQQEELPLVALTPHKFKKRVRTAAGIPVVTTPGGGDSSSEETKRLRQQLAEAERRERWYVATNLGMARELERLRLELETLRSGRTPSKDAETGDLEAGQVQAEKRKEKEMLVVCPKNGEESQIDRVVEHLERKSFAHEQEVSRLRQEVEEQRKLIELVKKSRGFAPEACQETVDRREQKRLRREFDKAK